MEYQDKLRDLLMSNFPYAKLSGDGKEVTIRCMYCGDSVNPRSAHLGVCLGYDDKPLFFHCFKCHASGLINHDILLEWGLYNQEVFDKISKHNKNALKLSKNKMYKDRLIYKLNNTYISNDRVSELKLAYINKRLGTSFTFQDMLDNKIVLNIKDMLASNNIDKINVEPYILNELDSSFLGFISQDNAFLNLRNLRKGKVNKIIDKRYINYNIFNKFNNTERYYTIPTKLNLAYPQRIRLNIAEGPFDILSIKYNLNKQEVHNIYSAILGSGYFGILKHFICTMKLINLEVHIYIDNDVKWYTINSIKNMLQVYQMPLYIHRNLYEGEKDFGVPINRIKEQVQKIL